MSASKMKYEMRQMYDFKKVYDAIGGRGNPVLTRERFENILQQLQLLYTTGKATNTSIYGDTMELTLKEDPTDPAFKILGHKHSNGTEANMKVGPNDRIYITNNGILNLADTCPPEHSLLANFISYGTEDVSKKTILLNKDFPYRLSVWCHDPKQETFTLEQCKEHIPEWTRIWDKSELRGELVGALEKHAKKIRPVSKIVCFGLGSIDSTSDSAYIQHLAACTIAKTLAEAQANDARKPNKIEIVAQDPQYTENCEKILGDLDPPIRIVDFGTFGALQAVDRNTIIVSIGATADMVQATLDIIPEGPAGILGPKMVFNAEREFEDAKIPVFARSYRRGEATERECQYKEKCVSEPITDDEWFGTKPREQYISVEGALWDGTGDLLRDDTGRPIMNGIPTIPLLDKDGKHIMAAAETELLLRLV
jgi:hypothetical protein